MSGVGSLPSSGPPSGRRVVLHVGLAKTGTTWLQALLAGHRDQLLGAGVLYPDLGPHLEPGAMFRGAVEVRGSAARFGLDAGVLAGTWAGLCERTLAHAGTTVISHEVLAGATRDQVRWALDPLIDPQVEVHVVVTARDLGRQVTAHWQEEVKLGDTRSFAQLVADEVAVDPGRDQGPDAGGRRSRFWHAQDLADTLDRWTGGLPRGRGHLVVCPAPGAPAAVLWTRFADACGIPYGVVDPGSPPANPSLGAPETALLRAVNAAVGDRLDTATRLRVVKRGYAEGELAHTGSPRPGAPAALGSVLVPAAERWREEVRAAGHLVHGDLADLHPVLAAPGAPAPDVDPPVGANPVAVADRLVAQGLRDAGTGGDARTGRSPRSALRGPARWLRRGVG